MFFSFIKVLVLKLLTVVYYISSNDCKDISGFIGLKSKYIESMKGKVEPLKNKSEWIFLTGMKNLPKCFWYANFKNRMYAFSDPIPRQGVKIKLR